MPQNEGAAPFIGIFFLYRVYRRRQALRALHVQFAPFTGIFFLYRVYRRQQALYAFHVEFAPILQLLQSRLTSGLDDWTEYFQDVNGVIGVIQQQAKHGLSIVTMRSVEAQYTPGVSLTPTNERSHYRRLDWARCLSDWSKSCAEWVEAFEKELKKVDEHGKKLHARQLQRRQEISRPIDINDTLSVLEKMSRVLDELTADMNAFHDALRELRDSVDEIPLLFGCQQDPSPDPVFYQHQRQTIHESTTWALQFMHHLTNLAKLHNARNMDRTASLV